MIFALPIVPIRPSAYPTIEERAASQSRTQGNRSHINTIAPARRKRNIDSPLAAHSSQKQKKATPKVGSLGSALIHVEHCTGKKKEAIQDFEKFAKLQNNF